MNHSTNRPAHRTKQQPLTPARGRHAQGTPSALTRRGPGRSTQRWLVLTSVAVTSLLAVPAAMAVSGQASHNEASYAAATDLVVNGGFEQGVTGWRANLKTQSLTIVAPGSAGNRAVKLTNSVVGNVIVNDTMNTVASTKLKQGYNVTATVRSTGAFLSGALTVRESTPSGPASKGQTAFYVNSTWKKVDLGFVSTVSGAQLDLNVLAWHVPVGTGLIVDEVHMTPRSTVTTPPTTAPTSTTTTAPTTTTTTTTTTSPPPPSGCVGNQMGLPAAGKAYLGSAVGGTSNQDQREAALGETLPINRNYFSGHQVDRAVNVARDDLAAGRLPWISFKLPYSWAAMASGQGDAWTASVVDKLAALNGPVWLAFHHEPEGDGPIKDWTAMQRHLASIVHARSNNVAYTVIYTSWDAFGGDPQYQLNNTWPGDQYVDLLALDMYNNYGAVRNGVLGTRMLDPMKYMGPVSQFAQAHGVRWGVAEMGYTRQASDVDPKWLHGAFNDLVAHGGVGLAYFDSSVNSVADWTLDYAPKFQNYKSLMPQSTRLC
jgi:hypothetical protein